MVNIPKMMLRLKQELFVMAYKGESEYAIKINEKHKEALTELK